MHQNYLKSNPFKKRINAIATLLLLLIIFSNPVYSQAKLSKNASQFQLEAFGTGSLFSIKFDSRITKNENGVGFSVGIGGSPLGVLGKSCNSGFQLAIPVGLNYLIGKNKHLFELGVGGVPMLVSGTKVFCIPEPGSKASFFGEDLTGYWYMLAGYRFQPVHKKGLTYRLFISPLLQNNFPVKLWGGGSVGIRL